MSLGRMELQFARSGHVPMSFRITLVYSRPPRSCRCLHWKLLQNHHGRFSSGNVYISGENDVGDHVCVDTLMNMDLPSLKTLCLEWSNCRSWGYLAKFKWMMPTLQVFECRSEEALYLPLSCPLRHLKLISNNEGNSETWWQSILLPFLENPETASIDTLSIDFSKGPAFSHDEGRVADDFRVQLHNLETLVMQPYHYDSGVDLDLLQHLDMPNLKRLRLHLDDNIMIHEPVWVRMAELASASLELVEVTIFDEYNKIHEDAREDFQRKVLDCFSNRPVLFGSELRPSDVDVTRHSAIQITITFEEGEMTAGAGGATVRPRRVFSS